MILQEAIYTKKILNIKQVSFKNIKGIRKGRQFDQTYSNLIKTFFF